MSLYQFPVCNLVHVEEILHPQVFEAAPYGGGGGVSLAHECVTHPRPPTSKMDPKGRIAPAFYLHP